MVPGNNESLARNHCLAITKVWLGITKVPDVKVYVRVECAGQRLVTRPVAFASRLCWDEALYLWLYERPAKHVMLEVVAWGENGTQQLIGFAVVDLHAALDALASSTSLEQLLLLRGCRCANHSTRGRSAAEPPVLGIKIGWRLADAAPIELGNVLVTVVEAQDVVVAEQYHESGVGYRREITRPRSVRARLEFGATAHRTMARRADVEVPPHFEQTFELPIDRAPSDDIVVRLDEYGDDGNQPHRSCGLVRFATVPLLQKLQQQALSKPNACWDAWHRLREAEPGRVRLLFRWQSGDPIADHKNSIRVARYAPPPPIQRVHDIRASESAGPADEGVGLADERVDLANPSRSSTKPARAVTFESFETAQPIPRTERLAEPSAQPSKHGRGGAVAARRRVERSSSAELAWPHRRVRICSDMPQPRAPYADLVHEHSVHSLAPTKVVSN